MVCLLRGLVQATFKRMQAERVRLAEAQRALLRQSQLPSVDPSKGVGLALYQAELAERAAMEQQKSETPSVVATDSPFGSFSSCACGGVLCFLTLLRLCGCVALGLWLLMNLDSCETHTKHDCLMRATL